MINLFEKMNILLRQKILRIVADNENENSRFMIIRKFNDS